MHIQHLCTEDSSISLPVSTHPGQIISSVFQYKYQMDSKKKSLPLSLLAPQISKVILTLDVA